MENHHSHTSLLSLYYLFLIFQFSSLSVLFSTAYTPPDKYFINCGSDTPIPVDNRNFLADVNSKSTGFSAGPSKSIKDTNQSTPISSLYQTARIFNNPSWYDIEIVQDGTYVLRLHFFPLSSPNDLSLARFNVTVSGFSLLSNFNVQNRLNSPIVKEFLIPVNVGKFSIYFMPIEESPFAFVNAIEAFPAPENFINNSALRRVNPSGNLSSFNGLPSHILHVIHRINVGGSNVTPSSDTLWRNWVPDEEYLINKDAATNSEFHNARPAYQDGGSTEYIAPDLVYQTAKILSRPGNLSNITWLFDVRKNALHLVRAHFCDIVSQSLNFTVFNFFIYRNFGQIINPYYQIPELGAPFYHDFVVDTDDSGFMNISIGSRADSQFVSAFLNGLEIMELMEDLGSTPKRNESTMKRGFIIIVSVVGGVAFIFILIVMVLVGLKCRKAKPAETSDWPLVPLYVESSFSKITEKTASNSSVRNLNLGLKIPLADILYATSNFDPKLIIGHGGFGKVYKGTLRSGKKVAVKRSEPGHGQGLPEFQTEIMVLSRIRHRHLVSLIGYCDERSEMILVYEFVEKGTLRDHLYNSNEGSNRSPSSRSELSWNQRLEICIGAAKGLHYLHCGSDGGIIHRDVKSTNILLDENYVAKVADFGISRSAPPDQTYISTEVKGSFGYLDPEYYRCLKLTQKSDVYSFGVVLLEVLCARPALNTLLPREQINLADWGMSWKKKGQLENIVDPLLAGKMNSNSLRRFGETVEKCLKEYGDERPSMIDVLWDLEYALKLQQTVVLREPHEDSTTEASWGLQMPVVHPFPSHSITNDESECPLRLKDDSKTSYCDDSGVFSQLKIDGAR